MAIHVSSRGYNVGEITVSEKLVVGSSVKIGGGSEMETLSAFAQTGVMKIKATIDLGGGTEADFDGAVNCNMCTNGFEFHTITYFSDSVTGGSPIIIGGQAYMDGTDCKIHLTAVTVS